MKSKKKDVKVYLDINHAFSIFLKSIRFVRSDFFGKETKYKVFDSDRFIRLLDKTHMDCLRPFPIKEQDNKNEMPF
jgi:hypothetical protein